MNIDELKDYEVESIEYNSNESTNQALEYLGKIIMDRSIPESQKALAYEQFNVLTKIKLMTDTSTVILKKINNDPTSN